MQTVKGDFTFSVNDSHALTYLSRGFEKVFNECYNDNYRDIIILCIGTDRSTGDSLGTLVGHKMKLIQYKNIYVYGTLDEPVHAKNLSDISERIYKEHSFPFVIAIDACLGKAERVGYISIGKGPLKPGAGVNKTLPEVGNIHIIGVVNMSGFMEYLILQNTRLNLVMRMADTISNGIHYYMWKFIRNQRQNSRALSYKTEDYKLSSLE